MEARFFKTLIVAVLLLMSVPSSYAQSDAPVTPKEKRDALLTPSYYTNWIGASFFTIPTIEYELDVTPVRIVELTFFYDFGKCFVGMQSNPEGVITQMTLRLFGDDARDFIQEAVNYGYVHVANGTDVNVRSNLRVYESEVKGYRYKTENGNVYLEVSRNAEYANEYEIAIFRAM